MKYPTMKYLLLTSAFLAAAPVQAGGPVITDEAYEAEPQRQDRKVPGFVWIALGAVVAAAILGGGDNCTAPEPEPQPETGC